MDHDDYCKSTGVYDSLVAVMQPYEPLCDVVMPGSIPMEAPILCSPDQTVRVVLMSDDQEFHENASETLTGFPDASQSMANGCGSLVKVVDMPDPSDPVHKKSAKTCFLCNKNYASQFSLNRHLVKQHKVKVTPSARVLQCPVDSCEGLFKHMDVLRNHIRSAHRIALSQPQTLKFLNMEAFSEWKFGEQKRTHTRFVRPHGKYSRQDGVDVHQFYCHRSGYYCPEGKGLRRLKAQGSCKMGAVCPAAITCREHTDGTIEVEYHNTHVGHLTDLEELYLSQEERAHVNDKVAAGSSFTEVLDSVRDSLFGEVAFLDDRTRKTVEEALKVYDLLAGVGVSEEEEAGVDALLQELEKLGDKNPVIFHRSKSSCDDFMVAIMSIPQAATLHRQGSEGIICIDDANFDDVIVDLPYVRHVVTVTVVDDSGRACPCAFAFTNRLDVSSMTDFFIAIRNRVGQISPRILMLHDSPHLEAWRAAMGGENESVQPLLSTWQTDATWRRHLVKVVGKPYQKAAAYKALRVLIKQPDQYKQSLLLAALQRHLADSRYGQSFATYLREVWADRVALWALCYRDASTVRADMELEALHREVSRIFLWQCRRRADTTIRLLLWYERCFHEGLKDSSDIDSLHEVAVTMTVVFKVVSPDRWSVQLGGGETCLVERWKGCDEAESCLMMCGSCNACSHSFLCSCTDALVCGGFCVHMHSVGRYLGKDEDSLATSADDTMQVAVVQAEVVNGDPVVADVSVEQPFIIVTQAELTPELIDKIATATFGAGIVCEKLDGGDDQLRREELLLEISANAQRIVVSAQDIDDISVLSTLNSKLGKLVAFSQQITSVDRDSLL